MGGGEGSTGVYRLWLGGLGERWALSLRTARGGLPCPFRELLGHPQDLGVVDVRKRVAEAIEGRGGLLEAAPPGLPDGELVLPPGGLAGAILVGDELGGLNLDLEGGDLLALLEHGGQEPGEEAEDCDDAGARGRVVPCRLAPAGRHALGARERLLFEEFEGFGAERISTILFSASRAIS